MGSTTANGFIIKAIVIGILSIATAFAFTGTLDMIVNKNGNARHADIVFCVLFGLLMFVIFI